MTTEKLQSDLRAVTREAAGFCEKYRQEFLKFFEMDVDEESALCQEIMEELLEKLSRVDQIAEYISLPVEESGKLKTDDKGNVFLNGRKLPMMKEFEICVMDETLGKAVWSRTFLFTVRGENAPRLAGHEREIVIDGLPARTRFPMAD